MNLLILGATGLVGRHALAAALDDPRVECVVAPTRRPLAAHAKLVNPVANDLETLLAEIAWTSVDSLICAMGTTMSKAGSRPAFKRVDYDLPMAFARQAREGGAGAVALVSSPGASASIPVYYCNIKAELEKDIVALGFASVTIIRPGMIGGDRDEFRLAERIVLPLAQLFKSVLPKGLRINPAPAIARLLLEAAVTQPKAHRLLTSKDVIDSIA